MVWRGLHGATPADDGKPREVTIRRFLVQWSAHAGEPQRGSPNSPSPQISCTLSQEEEHPQHEIPLLNHISFPFSVNLTTASVLGETDLDFAIGRPMLMVRRAAIEPHDVHPPNLRPFHHHRHHRYALPSSQHLPSPCLTPRVCFPSSHPPVQPAYLLPSARPCVHGSFAKPLLSCAQERWASAVDSLVRRGRVGGLSGRQFLCVRSEFSDAGILCVALWGGVP